MSQQAAAGVSEAEVSPVHLHPARALKKKKKEEEEERPGSGAKEKPASTVPPPPPPPPPSGLPLAARRAVVSEEVSRPRRSRRPEEGRQKKKGKRVVTVDSSKAKTSSEALRICIQQLKWKEFPTGRRLLCDIYWHGASFHDGEVSCSGQVNKYPGMTELVRKINFSRAVRTMQQLFPEEYKFYPRSWILPEEYQHFADQVRMSKETDSSWKPTFIVKPDGGSQGDGIYLIKDSNDIRMLANLRSKPAVVQEYVSKPLLIDKLKFDIRLYVLLKSLEPLEIYIAKDGLSRFCTEPYQEPNIKNFHRVFMHLTNYSLNVHSGNFIHSDSVNTGSKRTFSSIVAKLSMRGFDVKKMWSDIITLVIRAIIALVPELKVYHQTYIPPGKPGPTCFQILGFDILLMKNMKPVLLEVNANPSMRIEHEQEISPGLFEYVASPVDEEIKVAIIRDTLRLMDPALKKNNHHQSYPTECSAESDKEEVIEAEAQVTTETPSSQEQNWSPLCLKEVFPKYSRQFSYLLVVNRIALLFIRFLGIKGTMKLGPTGFRTFIRTCKLSSSNLSMASVDILYIDIARRWNVIRGDRGESGMCFQAFMEAIFHLAQRRYKSPPLREQVEALVNFCESQLEAQEEKHILYGRGTADQKSSLAMYQPEGSHSGTINHMHLLNRMSMSNRLPTSSLPTSVDQQLVNSMSSRVTDCSPAASFSPNGWDNLSCRFCRNSHQNCPALGLNDVRSQRVKLTQILHPSVTSYFM
ncbi:tubulin polyglutamylase TTLL11 isoform X1 [Carcharodon carcharias]|uniref:tubulin polyglutamylase TTLL11 isoform X1 n=1 Tax=Carcharodon carcharias TaxID=13397 RepID=UPI001B7F5B2F|nr:tubulin polyglutamylase TTLL11 isoform X1 [Carcharodon carcharias]